MGMDAISPETRPPWVVAHRGASWHRPGNTVAAFDADLKLPIDGIELDLQLSSDGVPVVFHHRTLFRAGLRGRAVHHFDSDFLRKLDLGGWFSSHFRGEPMPTLEEVLDPYGGKTRLLPEVKVRKGFDTRDRHLELARKVVAEVRRRRLDEAVYLCKRPSNRLLESQLRLRKRRDIGGSRCPKRFANTVDGAARVKRSLSSCGPIGPPPVS